MSGTSSDAKSTPQTQPAVAGVASVNFRTGAVSLTKADVGLSNVDNTSDANKPVSTATQTALNAITGAVTSVNLRTGAVSLTKSDVGLANVDNTSDVNKPVSTAQATADALKLAKASNLSDLASAATARTNLGLGTAATTNSSAYDVSGAAATAVVGLAPLANPAFTGTATLNGVSLSTGGGGSGSGPGSFLFSSAVSSVSASGAVYVAGAITIGLCRLSCTAAAAGSALTVVLQKSTDNGATWSTVQSLTIAAGSTTASTATPAAAIASGSLLRVNATSVGSTTAALGVLLQADYA